MILAISMPGGSEWVLICLVLSCFLVIPILLIVFIVRSRDLKNRVKILEHENEKLLAAVAGRK